MKRRIEITVETKRFLMFKGRAVNLNAWCVRCERQVAMVTPEEAARLTGLTARTIYRRAEDGQLHFTETEEGELQICRNSLEPTLFITEGRKQP